MFIATVECSTGFYDECISYLVGVYSHFADACKYGIDAMFQHSYKNQELFVTECAVDQPHGNNTQTTSLDVYHVCDGWETWSENDLQQFFIDNHTSVEDQIFHRINSSCEEDMSFFVHPSTLRRILAELQHTRQHINYSELHGLQFTSYPHKVYLEKGDSALDLDTLYDDFYHKFSPLVNFRYA